MFSVIICTYNGADRLRNVVEHIQAQGEGYALADEVLLVDNHSTDDTAAVAAALAVEDSKIRYLYEPTPGLSNARLCGVRAARAPWIAFLDDDNLIQPGWLLGAERYILDHDTVGAFNGQVIPQFERVLTDGEQTILRACYPGLACTSYAEDQGNEINEDKWVPFGAGLVIRREPLLRLAEEGWLSLPGRTGNQLTSCEDTQMVYYVYKHGYSLGFCREIKLIHALNTGRLDLLYLKKLYTSFGEANLLMDLGRSHPVLRTAYHAGRMALSYVKSSALNRLLHARSEQAYSREFNCCFISGYYRGLGGKLLPGGRN